VETGQDAPVKPGHDVQNEGKGRVTDADACWVLTDGKVGMENQCLGLAEALGMTPRVLRIRPRAPWRFLPPSLWRRPRAAPGPGGDTRAPPRPRLLIATGRQTVAPAIAIRRASGGATFTVQIQNPAVDPARFDLVVPPLHDRLEGPNVIATQGALHRVTPQRLAAEADRFRDRFAALPRPLVAVLLGGTNRQYRMDEAAAARLGEALAAMARASGAGLAITPSRRTGAANMAVIRDQLAGLPADIWDGTGENPYFGMLGLADAVVTTNDSVNMVTEACATGKPVHVFDLDGRSAKFDRFHAAMRDAGMTRRFTGALESWSYEPLQETARVAAEIRRRMGHTAAEPADNGVRN
jgi:mitochondrial fission protein ELM1